MMTSSIEEFTKILEAHETWIFSKKGDECANFSGSNFSGSNFSGIDLRGIDLSNTILSGANLSNAILSGANLSNANLSNANLSNAILYCADMVAADLTDANLSGAHLTNANLTCANLTNTNFNSVSFRGANLNGVTLRDANLTSIKADFFAVLAILPDEVHFLRKTLIAGKIDGSTYDGECCCLVGTMAHACGTNSFYKWSATTSFPIDIYSPRERWFYAIRAGETPSNNQVASITLEWIDEFLATVQS